MTQSNTFNPIWYSPPGSTICDILDERNISISDFAQRINNSIDFTNRLFNGKVEIDSPLATKLSETLGASTDFWLERESQYRYSLSKLNLEKEREWLNILPTRDMINLGWINNSNDILSQCLNFFNVSSIQEWEESYCSKISKLSFRTSKSFSSDLASVSVWLRKGEIIAEDIECKIWNKELFESKIEEIKALTRIKSPNSFLPELINICAECGVAIAIVKTPTGCKASGATSFISRNKALIMLSLRYLSDDHFWFTFFHEAGHLILHENNDAVFVEMSEKLDRIDNEREKEANLFAAEVLVPYMMHNELKNLRSNKRKIIQFAQSAGISPGIVVGQMQFLGYIKHEYLNSYKRRFNWDEISFNNLYGRHN